MSLINGTELPIAGVYRETLRITDANKETRLQTVTVRTTTWLAYHVRVGNKNYDIYSQCQLNLSL